MERNLSADLNVIGIKMGKGQESRIITVLRVVLNTYEKIGEAITFGQIYDVLKQEHDFKASKAWVHRILKTLVDLGMIRLEIPNALRKKYVANVDTVVAGLEKLKEKVRDELDEQIETISEKKARHKMVDCWVVGQNFVEFLTGSKQRLASRFITGMHELHRVLDENIHGPAGEGDIIRSTLSWPGPFMQDPDKRIRKYFRSAKKGVDVRWLVDINVFLSKSISENVSVELAARILKEFFLLEKAGYKIQIRVYLGGTTYNHSSLNNQHLALIITENPITATFVTQEFNKDLIEDVIRNFDELWDKGIPLLGTKRKKLESLGLLQNKFFSAILAKIHEIT